MRNLIFQVSEYSIDDFVPGYDINEYADFATSVIPTNDYDRVKNINCLQTKGIQIGVDNYGHYFVIPKKEYFFQEKYKRFMDEIEKLSKTTIKEFSSKNAIQFEYSMHELNKNYNQHKGDDYGCILLDNYDENYGSEIITLDKFVRHAKENTKYYIGSIYEYRT